MGLYNTRGTTKADVRSPPAPLFFLSFSSGEDKKVSEARSYFSGEDKPGPPCPAPRARPPKGAIPCPAPFLSSPEEKERVAFLIFSGKDW